MRGTTHLSPQPCKAPAPKGLGNFRFLFFLCCCWILFRVLKSSKKIFKNFFLHKFRKNFLKIATHFDYLFTLNFFIFDSKGKKILYWECLHFFVIFSYYIIKYFFWKVKKKHWHCNINMLQYKYKRKKKIFSRNFF